MENIYLTIVLAPLLGAIIAGLFGGRIGRAGAHWVTILGVGLACALSFYVLYQHVWGGAAVYNGSIYTWMVMEGLRLEVGFLVDRLTAMMMVVVTFVSLMVHVYTIGYMAHDEENWPAGSRAGTNSYQRFFSYIALFTFSMLMLVMANNFMQLFFGWEAVGLVSYLLIGFWLNRESAVFANLKAFLVNRIGDFGFLLGIAAVLMYYGSLDYQQVFSAAQANPNLTMEIWDGAVWQVATVACILLFIGAMGKSAQAPLHVWLPDSMEGPTPISALIHAATMVTAGIFMVARMSPLYELSETALSFVLIIGASTAFFLGLIGIVQNDIKKVVAYSTLSQLGYMVTALGVSAYAAGVFHLMTHAFFKALLFLGAGSVIIAMHHKQDMREMGGLRKYMPLTHLTVLIGTLALVGTPFFSGFFSKDAIIEAVGHSERFGADYAYWMVLLGVFVTSLYSFRLYFMTFWGKERMDEHTRSHLQESPKVVTVPLILLAIPSVLVGFFAAGAMLFGDFFQGVIFVQGANDVLAEIGKHWHGAAAFAVHGFVTPAFWLALAGAVAAWVAYLKRPDLPRQIHLKLRLVYNVLDAKYGFDKLYIGGFAGGGRAIGRFFWRVLDQGLIDGLLVNGSARTVGRFAAVIRRLQTGYLYHYAFAMIIGLLLLLTGLIGRHQGWL
ncbi:NADH-quinone oxidoreductase subunit L [Alkalilimnicola sp. S0819]|uniref:NADH-quinone oxidoreductase subunit L n=1 Tax=Alkalilimnicola sp. S0819 TaxID=2613922 RepID=UPI0012625C3D|nr:NADH-quinone oxidoreductase subunit L [Alkalilimnicola sp. S0819]KAB7628436.1 NADH-quinone oxidoreductase subunit L [Alkalilimnicola sp. S0819]MPQ15340.1 NADH-quinone oxidoreductase subunit L [Alkalilimnicola sp. S0819]